MRTTRLLLYGGEGGGGRGLPGQRLLHVCPVIHMFTEERQTVGLGVLRLSQLDMPWFIYACFYKHQHVILYYACCSVFRPMYHFEIPPPTAVNDTPSPAPYRTGNVTGFFMGKVTGFQ